MTPGSWLFSCIPQMPSDVDKHLGMGGDGCWASFSFFLTGSRVTGVATVFRCVVWHCCWGLTGTCPMPIPQPNKQQGHLEPIVSTGQPPGARAEKEKGGSGSGALKSEVRGIGDYGLWYRRVRIGPLDIGRTWCAVCVCIGFVTHANRMPTQGNAARTECALVVRRQKACHGGAAARHA